MHSGQSRRRTIPCPSIKFQRTNKQKTILRDTPPPKTQPHPFILPQLLLVFHAVPFHAVEKTLLTKLVCIANILSERSWWGDNRMPNIVSSPSSKFGRKENFLVVEIIKRNPSRPIFVQSWPLPCRGKPAKKSNDQKNHVTRKAKKRPHSPARNKKAKEKRKSRLITNFLVASRRNRRPHMFLWDPNHSCRRKSKKGDHEMCNEKKKVETQD